ncbi:hypothetical protein WJX79_007126 [Trebouxia sp. C0005]
MNFMKFQVRHRRHARRHANRENGQPARTNQAAADDFSSRPFQDITNTAGGSSRRAILTLKNKDGDAINDLILIFSQRGNSAVEFECGQSGREPRKC